MSRTVVIVGSSIAGPTLALQILSHPALRRAFRPVLFDAAPAPSPSRTPTPSHAHDAGSTGGATVGLFGNGLYPLRQLGVGDAVRRAGYEYRSLAVWHSDYSGNLEKLGSLPQHMYSPSLDTGVLFFERRVLQALLVDQVQRRGGEVYFRRKASAFESLGDGRTRVLFGDGGEVIADLLVGADGAYSSVRRHVLTAKNPGTAADRWLPDFMGLTGLYGVSDAPAQKIPRAPYTESHAVWIDPGFVATGPCLGGGVRWDIVVPEARPPAHHHPAFEPPAGREPWLSVITPGPYDPAHTAELVRKLSGIGHPYTGNLGVLFSTADRIIHTPLRQRVWDKDEIVSTGTAGNVALVGDAGRLMLPTSGQGTGFAIEDATVLARELLKATVGGDNCSAAGHKLHGSGSTSNASPIGAALDEYARARVPRSRQMATLATIAAKWGVGDNVLWRGLRRLSSRFNADNQDRWPFDKRYDVE